ncbi:PH domain-containing protein [Streptomyces sp. N2-109]|uniref:PH domain-containing protein n=1 Tax=Streptomyces gossypii TaxID=2883101 RepID=A0ABT2K2Q1_9ACTN|nr:PH domain-containing protein [Streptomyces gossypii]MCT2594442.1 PH domain-containing protein [Streptomyces gossypii]
MTSEQKAQRGAVRGKDDDGAVRAARGGPATRGEGSPDAARASRAEGGAERRSGADGGADGRSGEAGRTARREAGAGAAGNGAEGADGDGGSGRSGEAGRKPGGARKGAAAQDEGSARAAGKSAGKSAGKKDGRGSGGSGREAGAAQRGAGDAAAAKRTSRGKGGGGEQEPTYADRCFRSPSAVASGVALLALAGWLGFDAVLNGSGRTPWVTLCGLLFFAPAVTAYTLRPAVFAGKERLRVRNPMRTITVPWTSVESLQAGYTSEVIADGTKYQLWSIPVSLRARKGVHRHNERVQAGQPPRNGFMGFGKQAVVSEADMSEQRAASDQAIDELRELALRHGEDGEAPCTPGPVAVRWAYELMIPTLLGAIGLLVLYLTR